MPTTRDKQQKKKETLRFLGDIWRRDGNDSKLEYGKNDETDEWITNDDKNIKGLGCKLDVVFSKNSHFDKKELVRQGYPVDNWLKDGICEVKNATSPPTFDAMLKKLPEKPTDPEDLTFLHQNIDTALTAQPSFNHYEKHVFISKIDGENKYAFFQVPVFREYSFLNEKGVGFGGNAVALDVSVDIDSSDSITDMPIYWLWRRTMMEAENVDDVYDLWNDTERAAGLEWRWPQSLNNMNTMWVDSNDGILAIEQMHTYFEAKTENPTWPDKPDILWTTNHHRWNDSFGPTGSNVYVEGDASYDRNVRAYELLNDTYYGSLDYDKFYSIASDHDGGLDPDCGDINDICRHGGIGNSKTVFSWIIEPDPEIEMFSWIGGSPCFHEDSYHKIKFTDLFNAEESGAISMSSYNSCPMGYYFQTGSIPYLINSLGVYDYFLEDFAEDDDYLTNLTDVGFLSDLINCDLEQLQHEYTVSWTNDIGQNDSDLSIYIMLMADGVVNASLGVDDPVNNTWTTIQKAIDNTTNLGIIVVNNGTYSEDVVIDKSIILFGEDKNNVTINGSIMMINPHDYELISYGEDDIIQNVNMTGLELLFHFNNDTRVGENYSNSSVVFDYSGQQNNGTNNNATLTATTIKGAGAFMFNGINSSINLSSISALTGDEMTVSAWINWQGGSGTMDPIVSQSESSNGYMLYVNSVSDKPAFRLNKTEIVSTVSIDNGWHNIVGTHDEKDLKLYVDGVFRGNVSITSTGVDVECFIGYDNNSSYFNGTIDEIAIWNRTLSDTEISHIYDQHYGVTMDGFTVQNSNDIGISLVNHTDLTNFIIKNHTTGVEIDNVFDVRVSANFSDCTSGIEIKDCSLDEFNKIHLVDCNFEDMDNGVFINSSDYVGVYWNYMNCTDVPMQINNCDISTINVVSSTSKDNVAPDTPVLSGGLVGERDTTYIYSAITNDTDDDQLWYYFDWDDGNNTGWLGPYLSNEWVNQSHSFTEEGGYYIRVKTKDVFFNETDWDTILFRTETLPPLINSVDHTPDVVGFGWNVTLMVNATDDESGNASGIQSVSVNITYPGDSYLNESLDSLGNNTYGYVFSDTWLVGQYNYTIWVLDNAYNSNESSVYSFNVSVEANISVCTIKDEYGASEDINITDPPVNPTNSDVGYELLDDGDVLHIWNKYDSYYFNTTSGIQLTNHYDEYWTHNVLMLGYYNNDQWNLIYRTDELTGFNKDIDTDNETYVNATLWKDLNYQGYDFRLAIRYYLGVDDNELTVIPYIKNIDEDDIPYVLGFGWEMKNIQIDDTPEYDYIKINRTSYYLNQTLDEKYTNLSFPIYNATNATVGWTNPIFNIVENLINGGTKYLYLTWDKDLNYLVWVKNRTGQYNAPVTLFIKVGTLAVDQEKYTMMNWYDSGVTYYFNAYDSGGEEWAITPERMVDGNTANYGKTSTENDVQLCNANSYGGGGSGTITKVELRAYCDRDNVADIILRPVFAGKTDGDDYELDIGTDPGWSDYQDITDDPHAPSWTWNDITVLDCDVQVIDIGMFAFAYCSKVEIQVTYTHMPEISNPYPPDGSTGISISPMLNITVSDDDNLNITWYSNSGGSWQVFGTNNSVEPGAYHQMFANATVNGQWWYWKVNVSDGTTSNESSVYKFYTGYQSKIKNTGSTSFRGYLLIQVQYYNTSNKTWVVADDTVNETSSRIIPNYEGQNGSGGPLALDTIFNGLVNTSNLSEFGDGTYRVYAAFRDPDGDVLVCDDESLLEAWYEFEVDTS